MIEGVEVPDSPGWWLKRCYDQLLQQRVYCQRMLDRFNGDAPLPYIADNQRDAVRWFVGQSRTNFERLIVRSVLSRLRIKGIRTAQGQGEEGDADAFQTWRSSRGKLWSHDVHKMALSMSRAYVIVGKDAQGELLITAEDPRMVTAITDPENPYRVMAGLKVFYDHVESVEKSYLYLPGRTPLVAVRANSYGVTPVTEAWFRPEALSWVESGLIAPQFDPSQYTAEPGASVDWLEATDTLPAICPIVPFVNEDGMSEFEPYLTTLDRINQQILQRMTIATIQAFKQRAFKGLPQKDPKTGNDIDWDSIFVADPGAIWNVPASVEIWESGQVDLSPILSAIRDDVQDLAAVSGTPLYALSPDVAAQGSAEGASLQRETMSFKVADRQDRWEIGHEMVAELMFRTIGDLERADPGMIQILWAHVDRPSMAERAAAIAQTTGVLPRYQQLTEIWGMDPDQASRAMNELKQDAVMNQAFGIGAPAGQQQQQSQPGQNPGRGLGTATQKPGQAPRGLQAMAGARINGTRVAPAPPAAPATNG